MPELPEVETTRRGIEPHIVDQDITKMLVRQRQLRWPVPANLNQKLKGATITAVRRRGKYLLIDVPGGSILWHLGMSGSLRIVNADTPVQKHDHVDLLLSDGKCLRFNDPRRFGAVLWSAYPEQHKLIKHLGPEPLTDDFDGDYLFASSRKRKQAVKLFIMDAKVVVGVGNIYANEALFLAGIRPGKAAGRVTNKQYHLLANTIKTVLASAIESGGTTLKDFVGGDGKPGYFQQQLNVYGRGGEPCRVCQSLLAESRLGQRATVYCRHCQS